MKIIWLASYPKSGNTWLRFLLHNYFHGPVTETESISTKIPDIHRTAGLNEHYPGSIFCKTHFALTPGHYYIDHTQGFIYLLRHPRDVLLSNVNYRRMQEDPRSESELARSFIDNMGLPEWKNAGMGTWPGHVMSWLKEPQFPYLFLRYEDMLADTNKCFRKILDFLNVNIDEDLLHEAVTASSFSSLRALEDREKSAGRIGTVFCGSRTRDISGLRFINKGSSTPSMSHLGADLDKLFNKKFAPVLRVFGYE